MTSSRTFATRNTAVRHNHSTKFCLESTKWQIYFKTGTKKLKINAFKCWKWQHKWYNYMFRSYSFQNSRAFPMACATFETTAQITLGTLACSAIYDSFSWNASFHTLCQKIRTQVIIGQPWVTAEWRHVSPILINKMGLRESPPLVQF